MRGMAAAEARRARPLTTTEIAWIALLPCAIAAMAAIVVVGPPLGHALFRPGSDRLWPPEWWESQGRAEPVKHGRYLLAVLSPLLLVGVVFAGARRQLVLRPGRTRVLVLTSQACLLAFVLVAVLGQNDVIEAGRKLPPIFGIRALLAAAVVVAAGLIALRSPRSVERIARLVRETPLRRLVGLSIAVAYAATWLVEAVTTDRLVEELGQLDWTLNDAFAILDGRTPLVNYHMIYSKLLPYPAALALRIFGDTELVYSMMMAALSLLALLAVYAIVRRIVGSSLLALALFLPFVATGDIGGWPVSHPMIMPAMWPMRYGGAYLLAWLVARHGDGRRPRRAWIVFFIAGVVAIDDQDFGIAALVATVVALSCLRPLGSLRARVRLSGDVVGGVLASVALVSAFTLLRSGALPRPSLLVEWSRIFVNLGLLSMPMPTVGFHLVIYATFVAAIVVASTRLARVHDRTLLTGMLAWAGTFGLIAGTYYVGRSDDLKLASMLSAWSFALTLLVIASGRALAARGWRRPALPQLLVMFAFGLSICSIGRLAPPQEQIGRLTRAVPAPVYRALAQTFVREYTRPGERVAILLPESFRVAYDLGLRNVAPYGIQNAIVTRSQMRTLVEVVRREGVRDIFLPAPGSKLVTEGDTAPAQLAQLTAEGYVRRSAALGFIDLHHR
jgi:hypothetical protein